MPTGATHTRRGALRLLVREVRDGLHGRQMALVAAGVSFFAMISVVSLALLLLRLCAFAIGADGTRQAVAQIADALPHGHGVQTGLRTLAEAAVGLSWPALAVTLVPATVYGEGLRRGFLQLSPTAAEEDTFTGWRGRLGMVPALVAAPLLTGAALYAGPALARPAEAGGPQAALSAFLAFHLLWVLLSLEVLLVFRFVGVGAAASRATVPAAFVTGAFLCGFLGGFVVFLAIPVDWSLPFGGLVAPGVTVALGLWLYLLHAVLLVGYQLMLCLEGRTETLLATLRPFRRTRAPGGRAAGGPTPRPRSGTPPAAKKRFRRGTPFTGPGTRGRDDALARWAELHAGHDPSGSTLASGWVVLVQRCASTRPLRALPPDLLSLAGPLAVAAAVALAAEGGRWPLAACVLVVLSGLFDGLDGAVAAVTGRARPLGAVVDALADRVADLLLVAVLYALGAPASWCLAAALLAQLHEYVRARANAAGMRGVGALSVGERPLRVVLSAVACLGSGLLPDGTPGTGWDWATVCAVCWTVAGAVGFAQLAAGVARALR
ncbi:YhjD/YihY/BrkB family envelope integrity protein [Streptomyces chitinivorans]|uniref:YhjD/YihY/BrkB family envelope integrity protein n=1 Tax=Streptomyces chitinivorans TaxID=1257027 RepID=A0ABW7HM09_9ACTN|nr:YhjD/YihY/BrkB family envelope integrity protein [Streptomyces chitinivorans]MDH2410476.1 YhjD/YihY/BrkB family envelope integrity protein [Streptomyces chitinivorans]